MVLVLSTQQLADISAHAERVYPEECCGLMLGHSMPGSPGNATDGSSEQRQKQLLELAPLHNEWTPDALALSTSVSTSKGVEVEGVEVENGDSQTKQRRYWIDPKDLLRVQREAREKGLNIIGVYHSHPDHVAEPSECDRALAWPEYAYVIVSVCEGKAVDVRNWALDSKHQFQPEAMKLSQTSQADATVLTKALLS